ncbi:MAG: hypothetical protein KGI33_12325 [Thaumarchaeota archaeon]|nr:hypothetical protein [Nitrososphaerota archaeon]
MAFDIVAYHESQAGVANTLINVAGLGGDTGHTVNGDNITVPNVFREIIAAYGTMTNATDILTRLRLESPRMKADGAYLECQPLARIAAGSAYATPNPTPLAEFIKSPVQLTPGESLQCMMAANGATAADIFSAVVLLGDGVYVNPYATMPVIHVRATVAVAAAANAWTAQALTLDQQLAAGKYAMIGMRAETPTGKAARLVNLQETYGRPGCIPVATPLIPDHPLFRNGGLGVWGMFTQDNLPQVEIFAAAADAAAACIYTLDIVKVA